MQVVCLIINDDVLLTLKLGPDQNSGPVAVPVEFGPVLVPVWNQTGTAIFVSERVFKVAKRTVENRFSLKSENVEMLLFMKCNLRFLNFRY